MLRVIIFGFLGTCVICCESARQNDDWRKKGFYRPRRNPSFNDSQNSSLLYHRNNTQYQNAFGIKQGSYRLISESQPQRSLANNRRSQSSFGTSFSHKSQTKSSLGPSYNESPIKHQEEKSFELSYHQNSQRSNSFKTTHSPITQNQNEYHKHFTQGHHSYGTSNSQSENQRVVTGFSHFKEANQNNYSQNAFGIKHSQIVRNSYSQKTENQNSYSPNQTHSQNPFRSGLNQSLQFKNVTSNSRRVSESDSNFASAKGHFYKASAYLPPRPLYKAPSYLPPVEEVTTQPPEKVITKPTPTPDPAMASEVPLEEPDDGYSSIVPEFMTSTTPIARVLPAMAMEVPPEEDDESTPTPTLITKIITTTPLTTITTPTTPSTTTTSTTPSTTTTSTTPSTTTTSTTPSTTTTSTTPSTTTTSTTPSTTTTSTTPSTTTTSTTPSTTTTSTTPSTTTTSTTPSTTTTSTTPSTTITSTTPSTTTTSTTPSTTTTSTTPSTTTTSTTPSTTTTSTTPSTTTLSTTLLTTSTPTTPSTTITSTTPSTTTPELYRFGKDTTSTPITATTKTVTTPPTTTPNPSVTTPFKAPEYLPPNRTPYFYPQPKYPLKEPLPPLPTPGKNTRCDCDSSSGIDQRSFGDNPCTPNIQISTKPYVGSYNPIYAHGRSESEHGLDVGKGSMVYLGIHIGNTDLNIQISGGTRADVVISGGCTSCYGHTSRTDDTTHQDFYRLRRGILPQSDNVNSIQSNDNQNPQNQNVLEVNNMLQNENSSITSDNQNTQILNSSGKTIGQKLQNKNSFRLNRNALESQNVTSNNLNVSNATYQAPDYLPPREPLRHKSPNFLPSTEKPLTASTFEPSKTTPFSFVRPITPAAIKVLPERKCDPSDPSTYPFGVDRKHPSDDPCVRSKKTTAMPFVGPAYLPSVKISSSSKTLRLDDLKGTPRPVWHVAIYTKNTTPHKQICGGSVVKPDVVISAAHCFWEDDSGQQPAEDFAVGGNKIYRPWDEIQDQKAQKTNVSEIILPPRFRGGRTSFQDDIAVVKLVTPFEYAPGLRPVCVDFDEDFNRQQLKEGNLGTVAGWGYTDAEGNPAQQLLWIELPYVPIEQCIAGADAFLKYITSDKICAGEASTSRTLCKGDSGGGLAFWQGAPERAAPYLRGVASAAPSANGLLCNVYSVATFTQITSHKNFLLEHVPGLDEECQF